MHTNKNDIVLPVVVITYKPPLNFHIHIEQLFMQFGHIILVDNGSGPDAQAMLQNQVKRWGKSLTLLLNEKNLGIATALNQGMAFALDCGYDLIVTLDQDSLPLPGMANNLYRGFQDHPNREKLAILAPIIIEELVGKPSKYLCANQTFFFHWEVCDDSYLRNVTYVITSGSCYNLNLYKKIGPFRDDFFIDHVDIEYCLRAVQQGFEISVFGQAKLSHYLGKRQKKIFWDHVYYPTFHAPFRWYYISRNRIAMLRLYSLRFPHWFFYEIRTTCTSLIRILLFENQRIEKLKAILLGTLDGILGRMGEMSPTEKRILKMF